MYGDPSVGKTALAVTLAVAWSRAVFARPLCLTTGETFSKSFTSAVEIDDTDSFRSRLRGSQLLLVDNLDALANAPAAQTELAATLDELNNASRPVIVTSSKLPSAIAKLNRPLASRLCGGLSIQLARPSSATAREVVSALARTLAPKCDLAALLLLAEQLSAADVSVDMLRTLVLLARDHAKPDGSFNTQAVAALVHSTVHSAGPSIKDIAKVVARRLNVRLTDMRGSTRKSTIVRARGLATYLSRQLTSSSLQEIGLFFGGRDHSTVLHACKKTESMLAADPELATLHRDLLSELPNIQRSN